MPRRKLVLLSRSRYSGKARIGWLPSRIEPPQVVRDRSRGRRVPATLSGRYNSGQCLFLHGSRCEVPGSQTKRSHTDRARAAAGSRRGTRLCESGQARSAVNALPRDEVGHFGHHECQPARAPENDATDRGAVLSDLLYFARLETLFAEAEEPCGSTYHGFRCW